MVMQQLILQIKDEYKNLIKKSIYKQKQRNQFSHNSDFLNKYQKQAKKKLKTEKDCKIEVADFAIPKYIPQELVYRLASNVQLPRNANSPFQLGSLNFDLYCYNYKPIRVDRISNFLTFTLQPIERAFINFNIICQILQIYYIFQIGNFRFSLKIIQPNPSILEQRNQIMKDSFLKLHNKKLNKEGYSVLSKNQLLDFENTINQPFTGYISKIYNDRIVTQQRIVNEQFLEMLGLNREMITHHVFESGFLPLPFYFDDSLNSPQFLTRYFLLNMNCQGKQEMIAVNYSGEKFPVIVEPLNFYCYNEQEDCYFEYLYFLLDCDKRWRSKNKILSNYLDYFNLKTDDKTIALAQIKGDEQKICGYKSII